MNGQSNGRTVADIVRDLMSETTALLRKESELARAEVAEKAAQAGRGVGFIVAGAVLAIPAITVLLGAAVIAMVDAGFERGMAALVVGIVALVIGIILAALGWRALQARGLVPTRTIAHVKRDVTFARHQLKSTS